VTCHRAHAHLIACKQATCSTSILVLRSLFFWQFFPIIKSLQASVSGSTERERASMPGCRVIGLFSHAPLYCTLPHGNAHVVSPATMLAVPSAHRRRPIAIGAEAFQRLFGLSPLTLGMINRVSSEQVVCLRSLAHSLQLEPAHIGACLSANIDPFCLIPSASCKFHRKPGAPELDAGPSTYTLPSQ
jgi:hypothetical protein